MLDEGKKSRGGQFIYGMEGIQVSGIGRCDAVCFVASTQDQQTDLITIYTIPAHIADFHVTLGGYRHVTCRISVSLPPRRVT